MEGIYPLHSLAYAWRLMRRDGVTIGLTSHDRDVWLDGQLYIASPGMIPSTISLNTGLEPGGLDIQGFIASNAIAEDDLRAGKWDNAALDIYHYSWAEADAEITLIASGYLGNIKYDRQGFEAQFNGPADKLQHSVVPVTSPTCRADFGDADCSVNARRYEVEATVLSFGPAGLQIDDATPISTDFAFGRLRWLSGPNCGLQTYIVSVAGQDVQLLDPPAFPVLGGERALLRQGCDKRLTTCSGRFGNIVNFRGEPHLPGNDILARYPGAN